jgi:hypothetical protein
MTEACHYLHDKLSRLPRYRREDLAKIPLNGVYVLFEKGEQGHGGERIVRVGTHTGQNNLPKRIHEHLYEPNKDRSIFRKHVGRCLLASVDDVFLAQWEIDLTSRASREENANKIDKNRLQEVESDVTCYMIEKFSFAVLRFDRKAERLQIEEKLLSTIFNCHDCGPSIEWLGKSHPTWASIRDTGLWNVQGLKGPVLTLEEAQQIINAGTTAYLAP